MPLYHCCIVENEGASASWASFACETDTEAQIRAFDVFDSRMQANKIEVWNGPRLTMSYSRVMARTSEELRSLCARALKAAQNESDPGMKRTIAAYALSLTQEAEAMEWRANH